MIDGIQIKWIGKIYSFNDLPAKPAGGDTVWLKPFNKLLVWDATKSTWQSWANLFKKV
jgi:hypothetical protein